MTAAGREASGDVCKKRLCGAHRARPLAFFGKICYNKITDFEKSEDLPVKTKIQLGKSDLLVPRIAVGCMRLLQRGEQNAAKLIEMSLERGFNFFDHADIYGGGGCEELFSKAYPLTPANREKILLQSKCGIIPRQRFDFSKEHILSSVEGILRRLRTDYLDVLLLHRPDTLMEPEEVAEAFDSLYDRGMVRYFGVSNQNPMQMRLLQKYLRRPIVADQLRLGLAHTGMIDSGLNVNMADEPAVVRDGGVLEYCRLEEITIQPWSPFQFGNFEGVFFGQERYAALEKKLRELGEKYGVSSTAIALAWILRHPANMMPVTGTTDPDRLGQCFDAAQVELTRQEWYDLYTAAGNRLP